MIPTSVILVVSGIVCLLLAVYAVRRLRPRQGGIQSAWATSDGLSATLVLGLMVLFISGIGLIVKGIFPES
jgi:hypothetical protein